MARFRIGTHSRLQEWVAEELGYFRAEGLDYEFFVPSRLIPAPSVAASESLPPEFLSGAFETFEGGRPCDVSSACHWATNMAAAGGKGRMWGHAYTVSPSAIFVAPESSLREPADLAGVEIAVGYHSGSHFSTLQALEPFLAADQIKLRFTGPPNERLAAALDRKVPAAAVFGTPYYVLEQQGFRKLVDTTFMIGFQITGDVTQDDLERYFRALARAQQAIDLEPERFKHYLLRELPERYHALLDVRRCGTGERVVFLPYTREMFERTHRWVVQRQIFGEAQAGFAPYEESVLA